MKLKNYQILDLTEAFAKIEKLQIVFTKRFSYAIIINEDAVAPHLKALQAIATPSENYMEYEQKRNAILIEHAQVDSGGNIVLDDKRGVVFEDGFAEEVRESLVVLNDEHADIVDERNNDIKEYNELIMEDVEVNLQMVSIDDVPDGIGENIVLLKMLMPMID